MREKEKSNTIKNIEMIARSEKPTYTKENKETREVDRANKQREKKK